MELSAALGSPGIRKNRNRLACRECRRRKLKCDRNSPCSSCVRRRDTASCSSEPCTNARGNGRERRINAEARLEHLEQLVQQLAGQHANASAGPNGATASAIPSAIPSQSPDAEAEHLADGTHEPGGPGGSGNLAYSDATHWSAMLEDIQVLRSTIHTPEGDSPGTEVSESRAEVDIGYLFGAEASRAISLEEVLARNLPDRQDADRLVSTYFEARSVNAPYIHISQFRRQYEAFWISPCETSPLWISILFSILHIATSCLKLRKEIEGVDNRFTNAAARCLTLGGYFRPKRFAVEALLLYAQSQFITSLEPPPGIVSVLGLLVRLATTMGYHRDPDEFGGFSPFVTEMRRRAWSVCMQLDLLTSFHMGLPSAVQFPTWDTQAPSNLLDSDFDEDTVEMPISRPDSELAGFPIYMIRHRFMVVFEKILRHTLTAPMEIATEAEVVSLDAEIKSIYACLPEILLPRSVADSIADPPNLIVARLCISFIYHKCLCVLHRLYVARSRADSILRCHDAASALVRDFIDAYTESRAGGQLETDPWFMSSISWYDFLLGAGTLCAVLCATSLDTEGPEIDKPEVLALLERVRVICTERAGVANKDIAQVISIVDATMRHFGEQTAETLWPMAANTQTSDSLMTAEADLPRLVMDWARNDRAITSVNSPVWSSLEHMLDFEMPAC